MTLSVAVIIIILSAGLLILGYKAGKTDGESLMYLGNIGLIIVVVVCVYSVCSNISGQDKLKQQYYNAIARKDYKIEIKTTMIDSTVVKRDTLVTVHLK